MRQKAVVICVPILLAALGWLQILDLNRLVGDIRYYFFRGKGAVQQIGSAPPPRNAGHAQVCRHTLTRIQNAKRKAAFDKGRAVGVVAWEEVIAAMYPEKGGRRLTAYQYQQLFPRCPAGGVYTLGSLEELARCSVMGNETLDVADDHIIRN